jgi:hypothetical protein
MPAGPDFDGFEPEGEPGAGLDDVLDVGRGSPRWLRRLGTQWARLRYGTPLLVCAALAVIGIVAWTTVEHGNKPTAVASTNLTRPPRPAPDPAPLMAVRALAHNVCPLRGFLQQSTPVGTCALVTRRSPFPLIRRAIRRVAPGYRIIDTAFVVDRSTGLGDIQIRAANRAGDVLVVSTAAPPAYTPLSSFDRVETGIERGRQATTKYVLEVSSTGFRILVGATGPGTGLPPSNDLVRLAGAPALIW